MDRRKPLVIGDLIARKPIIQGGMGVGISLSSLAGAVAKEGGIGIISTAQIGFREPDFKKDPLQANLRAIQKEWEKARAIAPKGILGFNIMTATRNYASYVKAAVEAGADLIISGAGLPVNLPELVEGTKTRIAPIVSSVKSAMVICRLWDRKYHRAPDLVVIEGPLAGGHLGFSREELEKPYDRAAYEEEIRGIIKVVKEYGEKYERRIPVVTAGGIYDRFDVQRQFELGADGVQVATRFVTTKECDAPDAYKMAYIKAKKEDIVITKSPVGMPGRAIRNEFLRQVEREKIPVEHCYQCLETCNPAQIPYCITRALIQAAEGNVSQALLFCGQNAWKAERIETVKEVLSDLGFD